MPLSATSASPTGWVALPLQDLESKTLLRAVVRAHMWALGVEYGPARQGSERMGPEWAQHPEGLPGGTVSALSKLSLWRPVSISRASRGICDTVLAPGKTVLLGKDTGAKSLEPSKGKS